MSEQGAHLDIYDGRDGSALLTWPELLTPGADSYNIYMRTVTDAPAFTSNPGAFQATQGNLATVGPWTLLTNIEEGGGIFNMESGSGGLEMESGSGFLQLEENTQAWSFTVTGLRQTSYNAATQVITQAQSYDFKAVAVLAGVEVAATGARKITPQPSSIPLVTPMRRLWPFPNSGGQ